MKNMLESNNAKEWYKSNFKKFEALLNGESTSFLHSIRREAINKLDNLNFPNLKDENWKYTNITPILKGKYLPSSLTKTPEIDEKILSEHLFEDFEYYLLVFVNGIYRPELSKLENVPENVLISSLSDANVNNTDLLKSHYGKYFEPQNAFGALNGAYAKDGAVLIIPDGVKVEVPVQILFLNTVEEETVLSSPRNLVTVGKNSSLKVIMNYVSLTQKNYFQNIVNEVYVDESGNLDFYKVQNENNDCYHIDHTEAKQERNSIFSHYMMSLGGGIVRNNLNSTLNGEGIECNYYGLYLGNKNQHIDNHTFVDHASPNCESNELYKGILDDEAHGVFNGKIMVRKDAQKTNAYQSNKTILLSKKAHVDTKPELEIYADDVKCSHGATIGHLDDEAFFYVRSRGVPAELAKSMLIRAFANDIIEKVKILPLRDRINHLIFDHLNRVEI